jgi:putative ABC transport system permease protein
MFKNYFTTAIRNLKKNKLHTGVNVLGLSVAFICNIILFVIVYHEFSFDQFHAEKERLFKIYTEVMTEQGPERSSTMGYPQSDMLKEEVDAVEGVSTFMNSGSGVQYNNKDFDLQNKLVKDDFFSMFSFPIISGDNKHPLADLGNVVISKHAKKIIFNDADPIGKSIKVKVSGEWKNFIVSAVIEDFPNNSSLKYDVLTRIENRADYATDKNEWNHQHHDIYVKLKSNFTKAQAEAQIKPAALKHVAANIEEMKKKGVKPNANGEYFSMKLLPITDMHFDEEVGSNNTFSKRYLYTLIIISLFVLAIACFNFVNLNVARTFTRAREVGMRKCLGAGKRQIFFQMWGESLILCLIALFISIICVIVILPNVLNGRLELNFLYQPKMLMSILVIILAVSFVAGGYPAMLMSKLNTIKILKGTISINRSSLFRNSLIVVQFTIACLLISSTIIIYRQFQYLRTLPLGVKQENIISIPVYNSDGGLAIMNQLKLKLQNQPAIVSIASSSINIGLGKDGSTSKWNMGFDYNGKSIMSTMVYVSYDYFKTLGIKLLQGREFDPAFGTDAKNGVVVTESMAMQFRDKDWLGLTYISDSSQPASTIIGVVPDIHLYSAHEPTFPTTFVLAGNSAAYIYVKTNANNPKTTMDLVKAAYKDLEPGKEFRGSFMEENTERWYAKEQQLANIFTIASSVAIVLSCLGLFAIVLLVVEQRTKEIGVRKVLGASISSITFLLSKEFMRLVAVAVVIAIPLAWYFMNKWLQDFPYHTKLNWWLFAIGGISAIFIAIVTVGFHSIKAAMSNPVNSINVER